jgi:hypothetical protein
MEVGVWQKSCQLKSEHKRYIYKQEISCSTVSNLNHKEIYMKHIIALIATVFVVSAFAADVAKPVGPAATPAVATPAVTKADAPKPAVKKDEKKHNKSPAKKDAKAPVATATPATVPASK